MEHSDYRGWSKLEDWRCRTPLKGLVETKWKWWTRRWQMYSGELRSQCLFQFGHDDQRFLVVLPTWIKTTFFVLRVKRYCSYKPFPIRSIEAELLICWTLEFPCHPILESTRPFSLHWLRCQRHHLYFTHYLTRSRTIRRGPASSNDSRIPCHCGRSDIDQ